MDDLILTTVIPLPMVLFQILFLLVAIIVEAMVLRQNLRWPRRISLERAATINLLAVAVGWMLFFVIEPVLPPGLQEQVISFIFFDRFFANEWSGSLAIWLVGTGIVAFFLTFFIKLEGLTLLLRLLKPADFQTRAQLLAEESSHKGATGRSRSRKFRQSQFNLQYQQERDRTNAVLRANAASFTVILILLLLRIGLQEI